MSLRFCSLNSSRVHQIVRPADQRGALRTVGICLACTKLSGLLINAVWQVADDSTLLARLLATEAQDLKTHDSSAQDLNEVET